MERERYLVVKGKAGLGNRLLAALASIIYARITSRKLYIDWSDVAYSDDRTNSFPKLFAAPVLEVPRALERSDILPPAWSGCMDQSVDELLAQLEPGKEDADEDPRLKEKYSIDFKNLDYPADLVVYWSFTHAIHQLRRHFSGPFAQLKTASDEEILMRLLREHVVLSDLVQNRIDAFKATHFTGTTIGVHVRYTDMKSPYTDYPEIIDPLMARHPNAVLFLSSDNKTVQSFFESRYPRVVATEKWLSDQEKPIHMSRECPEKFERGISALTDMYLLSSCDYLIYSSISTFGIIARLLSQAPSDHIFNMAPARVQLKAHAKELYLSLDPRAPGTWPALGQRALKKLAILPKILKPLRACR